MVRVNISIPEEDFVEIKKFAISNDVKISSIFRKGAKELINQENGKSKN